MLGKGPREVKPLHTFLFVALLIGPLGLAQTAPEAKPDTTAKSSSTSANALGPGPTASGQVEGSQSNMYSVVTYDFNLGYKFNAHTSADIGVPLYTTRTPFSTISTTDWRYTTIIGPPYIDVRYDTIHNGTNITSILTGAAGINMVKTYSNGRMTVDWFNHFDRSYQILSYDARFTPFVNIEAGTGTVDRQVFPRPFELNRPYETVGYIATGEIGGAFTIRKFYRLEGSAYGLAPMGPQKIYSRIVSPDNLLGGDGHHNRYWDQYFETGGALFNNYGAGPSRIARDNGYGGYLTVSRFKKIDVELGYTQSVHYKYGSAFIMLHYNFTGILRSLTTGE